MKGKNRIDGSDDTIKKVVLGPGVSFSTGEVIYKRFLEEHWERIKEEFKDYDYDFAQNYKDHGCGYKVDEQHYFIYPTYNSFVINLVSFQGFCEIS